MQVIITSLSKSDLIELIKEAIKAIRKEDNKIALEKVSCLNKARKILKVSHYNICKLVANGSIKMMKDKKILQSELDTYLEQLK
jgi:hypothetical protein